MNKSTIATKNKKQADRNPIENITLYIATTSFGILIFRFNLKLGNFFSIIYFLIKISKIVNKTKTIIIKKQNIIYIAHISLAEGNTL